MRSVEGVSSRQAGLTSSKNLLSCCWLQLLKSSGYTRLEEEIARTRGENISLIFEFKNSRFGGVYVQVTNWAYPTLSAMMQPLFDVKEPQTQFSVSWDKPRLCPISCAIVEATPIELVLWSCVYRRQKSGVKTEINSSSSFLFNFYIYTQKNVHLLNQKVHLPHWQLQS